TFDLEKLRDREGRLPRAGWNLYDAKRWSPLDGIQLDVAEHRAALPAGVCENVKDRFRINYGNPSTTCSENGRHYQLERCGLPNTTGLCSAKFGGSAQCTVSDHDLDGGTSVPSDWPCPIPTA